MKKIFIAMFSAFMLTSLTSCNNTPKNSDEAVSDNLAYKTVVVEEEDDSLRIKYRFVVDFPVQGSDSLVAEIKKDIFYTLGDSSLTDMSENNLQTIGKNYISSNAEDMKEELKDATDRNYVASYANEGNVKMIENTDKYVTYKSDSYDYRGGAHGMPFCTYFTIDKSSNKTLTLNDIIAADKLDEFKELLKSYIVNQYYEGETPAWGEIFKFELPTQAPAITTNGVIFSYGAYEIDCYAAGMPNCTITYEDLEGMMTPEAEALIK